MLENRCAEHDNLVAKAHAVLEKLHNLTREQLESFQAGEDERFMRLDRELENTVGEKERAIGALRQHDEAHGCQLQ